MGQMRGLVSLGLMDSVDYVSCVSGGSWASVMYCYYKSNPSSNNGPITDAQFLGPVVAPCDIVVNKPSDPNENWLGTNDPRRMGSTATKSLAEALFLTMIDWAMDYIEANDLSWISVESWEAALKNIPYDQLWIAAIGKTYFEPFGLFKKYNPFDQGSVAEQPFFSLFADTVKEIRQRNVNTPAVSGAEFYTVRDYPNESKRPYLVVNGSVIGPTKLAPFKTENPIVFEFTPLYVGSAYSPDGKPFEYQPGQPFLVGNGYVEPFAFGGDAPRSQAAPCHPSGPDATCAEVPPPPRPFTVADASGISSSAFASVIEQNPFQFTDGLNLNRIEKWMLGLVIEILQKDTDLLQLAPEADYWPVTGAANEQTNCFTYGDGGLLDNYGLISMLRRRVKSVVVFINTSTKIDTTYDPASGPPKPAQLDSLLAPLFGIRVESPGIFSQHNQVFPKDEFAAVFEALKTAKLNGKTVMTQRTHTLAQNDWWGIDGVALNSAGNRLNPNDPVSPSDQVNVLWVYNERVAEWESLLTEDKFHAKGLGEITLKQAIEAGNPTNPDSAEGPFQHFPNYHTMGQNGKTKLVELTPEQVNLLADLSCWNITNDDGAAVFDRFLAGR